MHHIAVGLAIKLQKVETTYKRLNRRVTALRVKLHTSLSYTNLQRLRKFVK